MQDNKSEEVLGKLGKVADSLESATTQLTGVVTQQQLDVARERISKLEAEMRAMSDQLDGFSKYKQEQVEELESHYSVLRDSQDITEKEFAGLRALSLSSFALSVICLVGLVLTFARI